MKWIPGVLAVFLFISLQFPLSQSGIGWRDEGFLYYNANQILKGKIPYRDFFLTTTPGVYYFQALLIRLFGSELIVGRIAYLITASFVILLFNYIVIDSFVVKFVLSSSVAMLFVNPGAFLFYNVLGLFLILIIFHLVTTKNKFIWYFLTGCLVVLLGLVKQSYGVWTGLVVGIILFRNIKWYLAGILCFLIPSFFVLANSNLLNNFLYFTTTFSQIVKSHRHWFMIRTLLLIPFGILVVKIVKCNKWLFLTACIVILFISYGDLLRLLYLFLLLLIVFGIAFKPTNKYIYNLSMFLAGIFVASGSSGKDMTTIIVTSVFSLPLMIAFAQIWKIEKIILIIVFLYCAIYASTQHPSIDSSKDVNDVITFIHNRSEKYMLCFPYCPMLNYLTSKESPSFYAFFYPETFLAEDQSLVINDIKNKLPLIVIQKPGFIEPEANYEDQRLYELKSFLILNSKVIKETDNFTIRAAN